MDRCKTKCEFSTKMPFSRTRTNKQLSYEDNEEGEATYLYAQVLNQIIRRLLLTHLQHERQKHPQHSTEQVRPVPEHDLLLQHNLPNHSQMERTPQVGRKSIQTTAMTINQSAYLSLERITETNWYKKTHPQRKPIEQFTRQKYRSPSLMVILSVSSHPRFGETR